MERISYSVISAFVIRIPFVGYVCSLWNTCFTEDLGHANIYSSKEDAQIKADLLRQGNDCMIHAEVTGLGMATGLENIHKKKMVPHMQFPRIYVEKYTEDEWDRMPDSYRGYCGKECYKNTTMNKGSLWEYDVRGVYNCSQCGYGFAPNCYPDPSSSKLGEKMAKITEAAQARYETQEKEATLLIKQIEEQCVLHVPADTPIALPPACASMDGIDEIVTSIESARALVSDRIDKPAFKVAAYYRNFESLSESVPAGLAVGITGHIGPKTDRKSFDDTLLLLCNTNAALEKQVFISLSIKSPNGDLNRWPQRYSLPGW